MIAGLLLVLMLVCLVQVLTTYSFSLVDIRGISFTKFGELWIYGIQSIPVFRHLFAVCQYYLAFLGERYWNSKCSLFRKHLLRADNIKYCSSEVHSYTTIV